MRIFPVLVSALLLAACHRGADTAIAGRGGAPTSQGDGSAPGTSGGSSPATSSSSSGAACVLSGAPLCQDLAHACAMPGSALDPACGYFNGLPGGAYCSTACGSCPICRKRGVDGEPCEVDVESSCYPGLACVGGVCANLTTDGGACVNCADGGP
jgi:hypothetical protein